MSDRPPRGRVILLVVLVAAMAAAFGLQAAPTSALHPPVVTGTPQVGGTLTVSVAATAAKGTHYGFVWQARKVVTVKVKGRKALRRTMWVAIAGQTRATYAPTADQTGKRVRACIRVISGRKGTGANVTSPWRCSGALEVLVRSGPGASGQPAPPAAPPVPDPLGISFTSARFVTGSARSLLVPTTTGGSATRRFALAGTLPDGVSFDQATGVFTGPGATAWNFRATQIDGGSTYTCALTTARGVKCWGEDYNGQLGNGDLAGTSLTPVDVVGQGGTGTLSGITQIAAGYSHACALTASGGVTCWGDDDQGQLGDGATTSPGPDPDKHTPVAVAGTGTGPGLTPITQVSAGQDLTCALTMTGGVKCWGSGAYGGLGNGSATAWDAPDHSTPVDVLDQGGTGTLAGITQIAAGYSHTCALTDAGGMRCWGRGIYGALGNGATADQSTPVTVRGVGGLRALAGITQIAVGYSYTCALTAAAGVRCWGEGHGGRLGNGDPWTDHSRPVTVRGTGAAGTPSGITQITAGSGHTCALTTAGGVTCWGYGGTGKLGNGATANQSTPVTVHGTGDVGTLSGITQIAAGGEHTCALTTAGEVKCWGSGLSGRLGNGAALDQLTPVGVSGSGEQAGFPAALTVTATDGTASASTSFSLSEVSPPWLAFPNRLFTMGQASQELVPVVFAGTGTRHFEVTGALPPGVSFDRTTGTLTGPASAWNFKATQIAAGYSHTCALTTAGGVKCWGRGFSGQLGNGATTSHSTPVDVLEDGVALADIVQIAAGREHTCALTAAGGVKCWGDAGKGQLGNGATSDRSTPVDVHAVFDEGLLSSITEVTAGAAAEFTCALTTSGRVKCWGEGTNGQIGNGATLDQSIPVDVVATLPATGVLSGATQIAAGEDHACALTAAGGVKCWGRGGSGRLGNGATANQNTPVDVVATLPATGALSGITQIAAGSSHTCALTAAREGVCWGNGWRGGLGNGATSDHTSPVLVHGTGTGPALTPISQISAGSDRTCALTMTGGVKCWGRGAYGGLGNGSATGSDAPDQSTPVDVVAILPGTGALSGITQIAVGTDHACGLTATGGVQCWGVGRDGRLGNGSTTDWETPNWSTPQDVIRAGPQPGFPALVAVTVIDDTGSWTLGRLVLDTH